MPRKTDHCLFMKKKRKADELYDWCLPTMTEMNHSKKSSHRCLITYGASGQSITHSMCTESKKLDVDECYTLTQRDLKYTLLHLRKRVVQSTVSSFMCYLDETYGIKSTSVFGYSAISLGAQIDEHPGMSLIISALGSSSLDCWLAEGSIVQHTRGLLHDFLSGMSLESMTKGQMMHHVKTLKKELVDAKAQILELESVSIQNEELRSENRRLKIRLETQLFIFAKAGRSHEVLPPSP